ncbi:MAG: TIGR03564 family F420-dependent LLM class oxidoreductase [Acidimicrobiales bacterium]|nr:TIGR03564 family F420-dependent LLM class oxidoreductase [Acidimicrobiales bacterium]
MRIGLFFGDLPLDRMIEEARTAESQGFDSFWLPNIFGTDALSALTLVGHEVPRIEFGTAVVPTYPRHPSVMAAQALTVSAASGGRFTLGIGLSHQIVIENMFGYSFDKPVRHMREYLSALVPLLNGEPAGFTGETLSAHVAVDVPGAKTVPVVVAALGPKMLKLAAERAAGTVTWMTGPRTLGEHTVPTITAAADAAGTGPMRIVSALPVAVTDDATAARERAARAFEVYGVLPSYRAMLDREGAEGPADVAIVGTAAEVRDGIERMRDAGVTDFIAVEFSTDEPTATATRELLREFTS